MTVSYEDEGGDTPTPVSTYTVTYDGNGATSGNVPTDGTEYDADNNTVTVLGNTGNLAKEHYSFNGWNTKADGTGTGYVAGNTFTISANTTLFAQWTENAPEGITWEKANLTDLTSSDVFVIVGNNGETYALSNDNGTGSAPTAVAVTIDDDKLADNPVANIRWTISGNATDGYTFHPGGDTEKWLYCTNSNNGVRVGTNDNNTFIIKDDYLYHIGTSRFVGIYNSQDWRCYTSINSNIQDQTFAFYKKVDANDPSVATTVTIDATGITNTNVFDGTAAGTLTATVQAAGGATVEGAEVTWTSSEEGVATINADGVVTLVAAGTTTITAHYAGVEGQYKASSATYELTVTNTDPNQPGTENNPYTVAQARAAIDAGAGIEGVYAKGIVSEIVTEYNSEYGNITYNISADGTTTADQLEVYRGKSYNGENFTSADDIQVGDEVVVYGTLQKYSGTYEFAQGNQLVSLNRPEDTTPKITVAPAEVEATADETEGTLTVTYKNVDTEAVEVKLCDADGTETTYDWIVAELNADNNIDYVIGANTGDERTAYLKVYGMDADANDVYSNVVTITQAQYVEATTYTLATSVTPGKHYILVGVNDNVYKAMGVQNTNNRSAVEISVNEDVASVTSDKEVYEVLIGIDNATGYYTLYDEAKEGYLYAAQGTGTGNNMKTEDELDTEGNGTWTISISSDGVATIVATNPDIERKYLRYNSSSSLFSCYKSGSQKDIYLYERDNDESAEQTTIAVAPTKEYTTFARAIDLDFTNVEGIEAYVVSDLTDNSAVVTKVDKVAAGEGVILKKTGDAASFEIPFAESAEKVSGNKMVGVTKATDMTGVANAYILSDGLFYACSGGTLAAGKAYLVAEKWATSTAPSFSIVEGGEATGIKSLTPALSQGEEVYYDLSGRRVEKPTKGVYIVNGKKVLVP